ncbi:unnamed protein product [Thelazia callipaeda]|uniref:MI domain-containing protein n=1 Tax=Thelazia callipaeda TaxID=103827 RepID=A0A0N5CJB0_THECL|nr:unnamed protein product [Thelazia callipaeda]
MAVGDSILRSCKRKEIRKRKKQFKKIRRTAYYFHKRTEDVMIPQPANFEESTDPTKTDKKKHSKRRKKKTKKEVCKDDLKQDIDEDDIEIHRYERLLGYNKRKSQNIPQVFRAEGLDYLLEICDSSVSKPHLAEEEIGFDVNEGHKLVSVEKEEQSSGSKNKIVASRKRRNSSALSITDDMVKMEKSSGNESNDDINQNVEEDIYGRLVNKKTGNVLLSKSGAQEKLRDLELKAKLLETEEHVKLKKSVRGLINRLNEHTVVSAVKTFSEIYSTKGHNEVKRLFFSEMMNSIVMGYRLPDRLITEYALFIALIHSTVSAEVSSYFVENYIIKLLEIIAAPPEGKTLENLCVQLAELYNFKVIKVVIVIEIMQRLREEISDKCLACFKTFLSYCGNTMKNRDLIALQKCIAETQSFFAQLSQTSSKTEQLWYTVEEINTIKNADIRKFTEIVDFATHDHYLSIFRGLTRNVDKEKELPMSVDDIVNIPVRGRWWLIGSAWLSTSSVLQSNIGAELSDKTNVKFDASLLLLAKKAKMNTAIRRDIFCTIMSSMDEMDAFEKLLKLSLKGQQEREIVHICIHCALREAHYNSFYSAVIDRLCSYHKRFKLTLQYALWDRIKDLSSLNASQQKNLTFLIVDLLMKRAIGITVLKVIEFGTIDKITTQFLRNILSSILSRSTHQSLMDMFQNVVTSSKLKLFVEGLQIFIHMTLKKPLENVDNKRLLSNIDFLDSICNTDFL